MIQKHLRGSIIFSLILALAVGCTAQKQPEAGKAPEAGQADNKTGESGSAAATNGPVYPFPGNVTLTRMGETKTTEEQKPPHHFFEEVEKRTGIITKDIGGAKMKSQEFNLILASNDLPDIWLNDWLNYPGGPQRAIDQGYILKLNDVIDKYAPNLKAVLDKNPNIAKDIRTDDGSYYAFPFIRSDFDRTSVGPIIRTDWLQELGLPEPGTIDEWYTVLKAFKEKKGATAPLTFEPKRLNSAGAFMGAYGVRTGFYLENDKVVYGNMQPGYKEYLATMRKWYQEGLLDKDFASIDSKTVDRKMTTGASGAVVALGSRTEVYDSSAKEAKSSATYAGVSNPTLQKGEKPKFGHLDNAYTGGFSGAISAKTKNVEAAVRWLDYFYSPEGSALVSYGTEGVSYTMDNGKVKFTELVTNNKDGLSADNARRIYGQSTNFPQIQKDAELSRSAIWIDAVNRWSDTDSQKHLMPPITHTTEESNEVAQIMADVDAYSLEMDIKFILGTTSLDTFDDYVNQLKKLGIDKAVQLKQTAYDRYQKR